MTFAYANKIVGYFDAIQYPLQEVETAIPEPDAELEDHRASIRFLPQQVKALIFAQHTMATWFQLTGVGTPTERIQDAYRLDTQRAIEVSCGHKLKEYRIEIPQGMTARATLMGHIFNRSVLNISPIRAYEIMQLRDHCAITRGESRLTPTRMLYLKLLTNRIATAALVFTSKFFLLALTFALFSFSTVMLPMISGLSALIFCANLGLSNPTFLIPIMILTGLRVMVFVIQKFNSYERLCENIETYVDQWFLNRLDNRNDAYIALLGDAKRTWLEITCEGEQQNGVPR